MQRHGVVVHRVHVVAMTVLWIDNPTHPSVSQLHLLLPQIVYLPTSRRDTNKARNQMAAAQLFHGVKPKFRCTILAAPQCKPLPL